jgi:tRNA pseudouridine38-40 synthase
MTQTVDCENHVQDDIIVPESKKLKIDTEEPSKRLKKVKVAMLMGFSGTNYSGMQYNQTSKTIEKELFDALCAVNAISESNSDKLSKVQFQRSCRTDKKVHAARQVVSFKCQRVDEKESLIKDINEKLPLDIRVFDIIRTTNNFNSHVSCDSRMYEYLMPTFLLQASCYNDYQQVIRDSIEKYKNKTAEECMEIREKELVQGRVIPPETIVQNEAFRVDKATLENFRALLSHYKGTKSYMNFTVANKYTGNALKRHILDFTCSEPFVVDNKEWVALRVHGQSFMMHQIRKMIGKTDLTV